MKILLRMVISILFMASLLAGQIITVEAARPAPTEMYGNNLSVPVIFAEAIGVTGLPTNEETGLRGGPVPYLIEPYDYNNTIYYLQQTVNTWQADWANGNPAGETVRVDWSDNIVRQTWTEGSVIRVETVLFQDQVQGLSGYDMHYLFGEGIDEVWGTTGAIYAADYATVYGICARLVIQKIDGPDGNIVGTLYDSAIYERFGVDGKTDAYTAEINVGGKVIYGYNWDLAHFDMADIGLPDESKSGWYRLTFSLDPEAVWQIVADTGEVRSFQAFNNVILAEIDPFDLVGTTVPEVVLYEPQLASPYITYLEVYIDQKTSGKRK